MRIVCKKFKHQDISQLNNQYLIIISDKLPYKRYCGQYCYPRQVLNGTFCIQPHCKSKLRRNGDGFSFSKYWLRDNISRVFIISKQVYEFYFLKRCYTENDFKKIFNCL